MKIAVSGSHAVGKSTLIEVVAATLPCFVDLDEPYIGLLEREYIFEDPPAAEDFEVQLERSLASVAGGGENLIFDRAPADFLAYLAVLHRHEVDAISSYWSDVAAAMREFNLIVYVPVERPDRIEVPRSEYPRLRKRVDEALRQLLVENDLGVAEKVVEVGGSLTERGNQVAREIEQLRAKSR